MSKNKKTNTKAPAQAKVAPEIAQPAVTAKSSPVQQPVKAAAASALSPAPAKPVQAAKPVTNPAPIQPKVCLELSQPGARSVAVAGTFNSWQPEMAATTANGRWVKELTIAPGRHEYMFVVDGQWMADPNAKEFTPNPFGGQNSVLVINK